MDRAGPITQIDAKREEWTLFVCLYKLKCKGIHSMLADKLEGRKKVLISHNSKIFCFSFLLNNDLTLDQKEKKRTKYKVSLLLQQIYETIRLISDVGTCQDWKIKTSRRKRPIRHGSKILEKQILHNNNNDHSFFGIHSEKRFNYSFFFRRLFFSSLEELLTLERRL